MIAAIMQPYLFPYIGYFQLMAAVDVFVFLDDAQYIDHGWINRNRIRVNDRAAWLTLPVRRESHTLPINRRSYLLDPETVARAGRRVAAAYVAAPHRDTVLGLVDEVLRGPDANVAAFNARQLQLVADVLGIGCRFEWSSRIAAPGVLRGQDRILDLCRRIGATHYVNAIGGTGLYDREAFAQSDIRLSFLATTVPPDELGDGTAHLSVLDGLMRRGTDAVARDLSRHELVASP